MLDKIMNVLHGIFGRSKGAQATGMEEHHPDMEVEFIELYERFKTYSMTSIERMYAFYQALDYISSSGLEGDVVECGVWRGGSMMLGASALLLRNQAHRKLFLYDTFAGMTEPTSKDIDYLGDSAKEKWWKTKGWEWTCVSLNEVVSNMRITGYPQGNQVFVQGDVLQTLPKVLPEKIALLHLDTDWYESTYHELVHLFPKMVPGGVVIIDDYGHFKGAREAVDQYFREHNVRILLSRIDYTGRMGVVLKD
jgi:O-methyltransferase